MDTITLDELYEKLKKNEFGEGISLLCKNTRDKSKTKLLKIIGPLGKGAKGYVFRASSHDDTALKLSYQKDNYGDELETVMVEMTPEYQRYYLNLQWAGFRADYISIEDDTGEKKLTLDADVYVSAWEIADHTLKNKIKENFDKKFAWFGQFLKGLSVIHARDRAHFDIKLANLFLVNDRVKIGDFEFYLKIEDFKKLPIDVCGTPGHIAPEMFYDKDNITSQVDIFSAGAAFAQLFLWNKIHTPTYHDELIRIPGSKTDENDIYMLSQTRGLGNVEKEREFKRLIELITEEEYNSWSKRKQNFFKINYQVFHSLKKDLKKRLKQLKEELDRLKASPVKKRKYNELKVYQLLLKMMHTNPAQRIKINNKTGIDEILEDFFIPGLLLGRKLRDRYLVQEIIDTGGKGIIYKIFDDVDDEDKAIKLYPPKYNLKKQNVNQIRSELKNTRKVNHDNIIKVHNLEKEGKLHFIVMEYFQGENLEKELNKTLHKKFPEEKALKSMKQVLAALIKAHEKSVTHNAVKPRNIMIDAEGNVKILNFGWNRQLKKALEQFTMMKPDFQELVYVPPEMYPDMWETNIQADVWGFGVTLYQLLIGNLPYENQHQTKTLPEPALPTQELSKEIWAVLLKCLKTNRIQRYPNLEEIYRDLYETNKQEPTPPPPATNEKQEKTENIYVDDDSTSQSKSHESTGTDLPTGNKFFHRLKKFLANSKSKRVLRISVIVIILFVLLAIPAELFIFKTGLLAFRQGPYQIWYTGAPGRGTPAKGIGCAYSTNGFQWNRYSKNPLIPGNKINQLKGFQPAYPYIVQHNNAYHMLCKLEQDGESNQYKIGYANSTDGIHWDIPGYNPVTLDDNNITSPGPVIYQNHKFHMWYTQDGDIYYANTEPGYFILKLKRHGNTPVLKKGTTGQWDDQALEPGTVIFDSHDNLFKMWYTGKSDNSNKIGYAFSTNGIQWNKHPDNPVYDDDMVNMEMYPAVVKITEKDYKMYYTAAKLKTDYYPICLATSTNGITWKKYSNIPVISPGQAEWEKDKIYITAVSYKGGKVIAGLK